MDKLTKFTLLFALTFLVMIIIIGRSYRPIITKIEQITPAKASIVLDKPEEKENKIKISQEETSPPPYPPDTEAYPEDESPFPSDFEEEFPDDIYLQEEYPPDYIPDEHPEEDFPPGDYPFEELYPADYPKGEPPEELPEPEEEQL